jgi:hypothetical protein
MRERVGQNAGLANYAHSKNLKLPYESKTFYGLKAMHDDKMAKTAMLHISINIGATKTIQSAKLLSIACIRRSQPQIR